MINHYLPHPICGAYTMCARTPAEKAAALAEVAECDACANLKTGRPAHYPPKDRAPLAKDPRCRIWGHDCRYMAGLEANGASCIWCHATLEVCAADSGPK